MYLRQRKVVDGMTLLSAIHTLTIGTKRAPLHEAHDWNMMELVKVCFLWERDLVRRLGMKNCVVTSRSGFWGS
jgi:hypothetical protein